MVLSDQLTDLFENIFHTFLCAFRKDCLLSTGASAHKSLDEI
jgi:hypothetical protein